MPLVDPVTNSAAGGEDKTQVWMSKLAGKKIGDSSDETTFAKQDLPEEHRIIEPGSMVTKDFKENRSALASSTYFPESSSLTRYLDSISI
ncbi:hypothetical protein BGAL_0003g00030 [Botrytis galanthina]|uniref:Uncharacterized protein n=1 Tax=Botrytis galanthina TaxID=278940 RepID=A0A4S8RC62_9HELO|nr:hypothetical protein BGAL_0003g00030 [Botrytis galanthina]